MTIPRRRVLRPPQSPVDNGKRQERLTRRRNQLQKEQASLARWMCRLKRAFHALEKQQVKVSRLEREISRLEQG